MFAGINQNRVGTPLTNEGFFSRNFRGLAMVGFLVDSSFGPTTRQSKSYP